MPITIHPIDDNHGVLFKIQGKIKNQDFIEATTNFHSRFFLHQNIQYIIIDYSDSENRDIPNKNTEDLSNLKQAISKINTTCSIAIFANEQSNHLNQVWQEMVKNLNWEVNLFTDIQSLESWLSAKLNEKYNGFLLMPPHLIPEQSKNILDIKIAKYLNKMVELQVQLDIESRTDHLTGLLHRKSFNEFVEPEMNRMERKKRPLSFILSNIDYFKNINDNYGHNAGDEILVFISALLKSNTRTYDKIWRWGGEEFFIMLPETELGPAGSIANKLRNLIEKAEYFYQENKIPLTMSFGVAEIHSGESIDQLLIRIDSHLYQAKQQGRNCIIAK
ncbi:MAG: GGDEF domain-containing protein [Spirochaetes bacterium]|nr:GGDEF domain-containing protein [Spirochaetota bacterium]